MAVAVMTSPAYNHYHHQSQPFPPPSADNHHHYPQQRAHQWPTVMASGIPTSRGRPLIKHAPPTPPMSSTFEARRPTVTSTEYAVPGPSRVALPPIAHLDRTLSSMHPLTPPDDGDYTQQVATSTSSRLPPILPGHYHHSPAEEPTSMPVDDPFISIPSGLASKHQLYEIPPPPVSAPMESESHSHSQRRHSSHMQTDYRREPELEPAHHQPTPACVWDSAPHRIDWLDFTRNRSAHFIAEKTCEMICYLWFASSPVTRRPTPAPSSRNDDGALGNGLGSGGERGVISGGDGSMSYPSPNHSPSSPSRMANSASGETSSLLSVPSHHSKSLTASPTRSPPSTLQLVATPSFISFMQKLLETTQVSQSVIVLSLHYIYRLKEKNHFTQAQRGSEFRIAVAGLMMANKFLDDNTYTNKTWSEVSGIDLAEINHMEREFLQGVDFNLYVDKPTYESWLNLLKGLVQAKERDARNSRDVASRRRDARDSRKVPTPRYHPNHSTPRATRNPQPQPTPYQPPAVASPPQQRTSYSTTASAGQAAEPDPTSSYATPTRLPPLSRAVPSAYYYPYTSTTQHASSLASTQLPHTVSQPHASHHGYSRARSTSPTPAGFSAGNVDVRMSDASLSSSYANAPVSHKRTAEAAFSPTSASFGAHLPSKRPSSMIVTIPDSSFSSGMGGSAGATTGSTSGVITASSGYENSPLDTLSGFSRMSLVEGSPQKRQQHDQTQYHQPQPQPVQYHQPPVPSTLVAPYSYQVDSRKSGSQPRELYFYTLASSPMEAPMPTRSRASGRKSTTPMDVPVADRAIPDADQTMDDDVVEVTAEEWERGRERDAHGERKRTRKARLMRWSTSSSSSSTAPFDGSSGGYAYDFSKTWSSHRQHQQPQQQPPAPVTSYNTSSVAGSQGYQYSQPHDANTTTGASAAAIPSLVHPVPRPYIPVVQSAHTSPASGVVYVPRTGEVGYATGYLSQQHQQPPSSSYQNPAPAPETAKAFEPQHYAPPAQPSQPQHPKTYEYPPIREQPPRQSVHHYRSQSRGHSQPWYTQNQGGSVSYHPSPVQEKRDYVEYNRHHRYAGESAVSYVAPVHHAGHAAVNLPHFHDNVWSKPPVVLAQREYEQQQVDRPPYPGVVDVDVVPVSRSRSPSQSQSEASEDSEDVIPSAPFANAGPAGVSVPFGSEYARYQGHHQQSAYQPHQSSSMGYSTVQHQHYHHSGPHTQRTYVQPATGGGYTYVYAQHPTSKYGDEQQWSTRGRVEY